MIAVSRDIRYPDFPDCPTIREVIPSGLSEDMMALVRYCETSVPAGDWYVAPPGVPEDRAKFLTEAFIKAEKDNHPAVQAAMEEDFSIDELVSTDELKANVKETIAAGEQIVHLINELYEKYKA